MKKFRLSEFKIFPQPTTDGTNPYKFTMVIYSKVSSGDTRMMSIRGDCWKKPGLEERVQYWECELDESSKMATGINSSFITRTSS